MISTESAINQVRRGLTLGAAMRWGLIALAIAVILAPVPFGALLESTGGGSGTFLAIIGAAWIVLSFRSLRGSRIVADSPMLIASGQYDLAERRIAEALSSFSLFRNVKLTSLHHLAVLRHAQNRWQDSAQLCRALLRQRIGSLRGLQRSSHLILAESLLELNDLAGVYDSIARLYNQLLSLGEALNLLAVQLDYSARIGAWNSMLENVEVKVQCLELLPTLPAARGQALLALAAKKIGREDWMNWLRARVGLLAEAKTLRDDRPMLAELWAGGEDEKVLVV